MERKERWQYYTSSYVRIEPTEGVIRKRMHKSVLPRNLPSGDTESEDGNNHPKPLVYSEDLTLRICVNSFKIIYKEPGSEFFIYTDKPLTWDSKNKVSAAKTRLQRFTESRNEKFREKFHMNNAWMRDLNHDQVSKVTADFHKWMTDGVVPGTEAPIAAGDEMVQ
jgi:paired amphipathic helix protein Sin3a